MKLNLQVNKLPMTTYRWLDMNSNEMAGEDILIAADKGPDVAACPVEVSVYKKQTEEEVAALFAPARKIIDASDAETTPPNGDTTAALKRQVIPTGMGPEVDRMMEEMDVKTDVYSLKAGAQPRCLLMFNYHMADGEGILHRQVIHAEKGSEITVIMDYHTDREAAGFLGVQTRLYAEDGAKIHLIKVQMLGEQFMHFDDIGGVIGENAQIRMTRLEFGADRVWHGCHMNLVGDGADFTSHTGYLCRRQQRFDINYVATQRGKNTNASMIFNGVLLDQGHKTYRGTLDFRKHSSGSTGEESEDTLVLSPEAVNRAIPVILCQEEDVMGHHGATIGQIAEDTLFYMQSRGISEAEARRILIRARLLHISREIPERRLLGHVEDYLRKTL